MYPYYIYYSINKFEQETNSNHKVINQSHPKITQRPLCVDLLFIPEVRVRQDIQYTLIFNQY